MGTPVKIFHHDGDMSHTDPNPGATKGMEISFEGEVQPQDVPAAIKQTYDMIQADIKEWERVNEGYLSTLNADAQVQARQEAFNEVRNHYSAFWPALRANIIHQADTAQRKANAAKFPLRMQGDATQRAQGSTEYGIGVTLAAQGIRSATASLESALRERAIDRASAIVATLPNVDEQGVTPDARARWNAAVGKYHAVTGAGAADQRLGEVESAMNTFNLAEKAVTSGRDTTDVLMILGAAQLLAQDKYKIR